MKRWRIIFVLVAIAVLAYAVDRLIETRAQQKREIGYQAALRSYATVLTPGMTRKQAEEYLRRNGKPFQQMCCINSHKDSGTWDDLVKIGQEEPPWFCSELNVYIGLQFISATPKVDFENRSAESDTLAKVEIFRWLEGCL